MARSASLRIIRRSSFAGSTPPATAARPLLTIDEFRHSSSDEPKAGPANRSPGPAHLLTASSPDLDLPDSFTSSYFSAFNRNYSMYRLACAAGICILLSWSVGCTPQTAKAPPTVKVGGTVSLD